ncbi:hypothetical protein EVAR_22517_1 [Eumeta japonica]|uniref:Uncharacterized protein n=1 Tax=Eumeta variegata TaxID=151549 RepID=A0A4C1U7D4_EUMVA|nr:hypothetical protein EVAR_22517_1 [Eumeta japonica]
MCLYFKPFPLGRRPGTGTERANGMFFISTLSEVPMRLKIEMTSYEMRDIHLTRCNCLHFRAVIWGKSWDNPNVPLHSAP